jgi:hypothetical protein
MAVAEYLRLIPDDILIHILSYVQDLKGLRHLLCTEKRINSILKTERYDIILWKDAVLEAWSEYRDHFLDIYKDCFPVSSHIKYDIKGLYELEWTQLECKKSWLW